MDYPETLAEQILCCTAPFTVALESGGQASGTATFFHFSAAGRGAVPVLLAPRQLLAAAASVTFRFHDGVKNEGRLVPTGTDFTLEVPKVRSLVLAHPDPDVDLVALPLQALAARARRSGHEIFHVPLEEAFLGTPTVCQGLHKHEPVKVVGHALGANGEASLRAEVRRGATGIHPSESFQGRELGVVDVTCLPGAAGSPVLIVDEDGYQQGEKRVEGERLIFLGTLSSQAVPRPLGEGGDEPDPAHYVKARALVTLGKEIRTKLGLT